MNILNWKDILGNVNKLPDPLAQAETIDCIAVVVDILLSTARTPQKGTIASRNIFELMYSFRWNTDSYITIA